jgi:hypothetical protein
MKTFIQLLDGIGFAVINTANGEPDHSVTPDNTTAIEVEIDNPEQFLNKKYNADTKTWSDAELIYYADVDSKGKPIEIKRTYFAHEAEGKPILTEDIDHTWTWNGTEWEKPYIDAEETTPTQSIAAPLTQDEKDAEIERLRALLDKQG